MNDVKHYRKIKEIYNDLKELGDIEGIKALQAQVKEVYDITLETLCSYSRKPVGYWTKERCIESAKQYKSKSAWYVGEASAYKKSLDNGWLDECTKHMKLIRKPASYWTKESCIESAKQYKSKSAWRSCESGPYNTACKKGWLDECTKHMTKRKTRPSKYWTKERCIESAKQFKSRSVWQKGGGGAYNKAYENGWLDECTKHMKLIRKPASYWTKERCIESAKQYKSRSTWQSGERGSYNKAVENGWMDELCEHMIVKKQPKGYWTKERCIESAKHYKSRSTWKTGESSAYVTACKKGWMDECCKHMPKSRKRP